MLKAIITYNFRNKNGNYTGKIKTKKVDFPLKLVLYSHFFPRIIESTKIYVVDVISIDIENKE